MEKLARPFDFEWQSLHRWFTAVAEKHSISPHQLLQTLGIEVSPILIQHLSKNGEKIPISTNSAYGQDLRTKLLACQADHGFDPQPVSLTSISHLTWKERVEDFFCLLPTLLKCKGIDLINVTDEAVHVSVEFLMSSVDLELTTRELVRKHLPFIPATTTILVAPVALINSDCLALPGVGYSISTIVDPHETTKY